MGPKVLGGLAVVRMVGSVWAAGGGGVGGALDWAGASSSVRSARSPNKRCRTFSWSLVVGRWVVAFRRCGGRGGTMSRPCSLRALVADDRWMIVPTFGTLVRAMAFGLVVRPVGLTIGGARSVWPRFRIVRVTLGRLGSARTWAQRSSNSSSVAASTGFLSIASVPSAMASGVFCACSLTATPLYPPWRHSMVGVVWVYGCWYPFVLECSIIRRHCFSVDLVYPLASASGLGYVYVCAIYPVCLVGWQ